MKLLILRKNGTTLHQILIEAQSLSTVYKLDYDNTELPDIITLLDPVCHGQKLKKLKTKI